MTREVVRRSLRSVPLLTVVTNRGWSMKSLSGVEKREKEDAVFTLLFESSSR